MNKKLYNTSNLSFCIFVITIVALYAFSYVRYFTIDPVDSVLSDNVGCVKATFFLPEDQRSVKRTLLRLIEQEKKSICVACYRFTHPAYAQALIKAYKRGVAVTVVADESFQSCSESMVPLLIKAGIAVFIYIRPFDKAYSLMHNKYMIFSDHAVWTGSFNFTRSALVSNCENVALLSGRCVQAYQANFSHLLTQSFPA